MTPPAGSADSGRAAPARGAARRGLAHGGAMRLLLVWLMNALALIAVPYFLPGIAVDGFASALMAALLLGLVNTLVRPVLVLLTLPITLVTLGLFILAINGFLFWFVGSVMKGFTVSGFWYGVGGALLYSVFSWALSTLLPNSRKAETNE
jgi:putative membrane protein